MADNRDFEDALATGFLTAAVVGLEFLIFSMAGWRYRTQASALFTMLATAGALTIKDKRLSGPLALGAGVGTLMTLYGFYTSRVSREILVASMEPYKYIGLTDVEELHLDHKPSLVRTDTTRRSR